VVVGLLVVLVSLWLIYKLLLLAAQRIFLMDYGANDIMYCKSESRVPLWLFVNAAGQKFQRPSLTFRVVEVIDLLQIPVPSALPYDSWQATDRLIIVDHLASRLHEGTWRVAVLSMLEALAFRYTGPVVILSESDPLYSLREWVSGGGANNAPPKGTVGSETAPQGTAGAKDISITEEFERWTRVFAEFSRRPLTLPDAPDNLARKVGHNLAHHLAATLQNHTAPADKTAQREDDGLEARFWTIWLQCTRSEKLSLRQLAEEGFLNPGRSEVIRSEVIRSLGHRLLLYRSPALQMSPCFRQFVLRAESSQTIAQWEGETEASWFSRLQMPLLAGLIAVVAILLRTQQELYTTVVALVGTFTAVLPHMIQLFGTRGPRGENP
jgi:hypothetical protein